MRPAFLITLAILSLAGCESAPPPYPVYSQPYVITAPAVPAPEPPRYTPLPPPPVAAPIDPASVSPEIAEPLPLAAESEPARDPVEDVLLKPVFPPTDAEAQTPVPVATPGPRAEPPSETGGAVPLMGFRPMRGQKQPGA